MIGYRSLPHIQEDAQDLDALTLAKSYFDLKEYDRAAYFLKGCCSQKAYFLYMYSRYLLKSLSLPDCWIKDFFMAHMYTELQMIKEALQKYQNLIEAGFSKSTYIISQIAVAYHNIRGFSNLLFGTVLNV
ncbi:hypothetical protein XENOCAPTIV_002858 [Xenoophorus captivus]|uniref:Cdc23 domain-containing protein n=1 Tax=Xenoophorus captivus TaxID=1517983 RepID=A0ABV0QQS8_9TELE